MAEPGCTCESMGGVLGAHRPDCPWQVAFEAQLAAEEKDLLDALARALCNADGKVYWTEHIPACYRIQAEGLLALGWQVTPPERADS